MEIVLPSDIYSKCFSLYKQQETEHKSHFIYAHLKLTQEVTKSMTQEKIKDRLTYWCSCLVIMNDWLVGWLIVWAYFYMMPMPSQSRLSKLSIDTKIVSIGLKLATVQALLCNIIEYWFILTIYTIISSQFNLFRRRRLFYVVGDAKAVVVFF